uniref:YjeF N-terminal domain-containing protein n=1 Tax=Salvator merianae TaxID=96440 RepID=A0A8D0BVB8_SALMN
RGQASCIFNRSKEEGTRFILQTELIEAAAIEKELLEEFRFGRQQLIEIWGHASAMAVTKVFPLRSLPKKQPTLLVVCGCEQNGAIGLACARHLRVFVGTSLLGLKAVLVGSYGMDRNRGTQQASGEWQGIGAKPGAVGYLTGGSSDGISPDVLVSLAAPKQCATRFMGKHHLVAGRFLPYDVQKKFELNLPEYSGTECVVSL